MAAGAGGRYPKVRRFDKCLADSGDDGLFAVRRGRRPKSFVCGSFDRRKPLTEVNNGLSELFAIHALTIAGDFFGVSSD